ncbi:MAG: HDOD domain-containing protein [Myxococcales bacterium]|nr:HDOD domain-containing protein [Myxococcales bacterium]
MSNLIPLVRSPASTSNRDLVTAIVASATRLPSPSPLLARILQVAVDPDADVDALVAVARLESALVARLMRAANSSFYKRSFDVTSFERAAVVLGRSEVLRLVLGQATRWLREAKLGGYHSDGEEVWRKSLYCAIAAEELASRKGGVSPSIAYTAAMLLDIGKAALSQWLRESDEQVVGLLGSAPPTDGFDAIERGCFGIDHAELGAILAETWQFPPSIAAAIRYHHTPEAAPDHARRLAFIVHVADGLSMMVAAPSGIDGLRYPLAAAWEAETGLAESDIDSLMGAIVEAGQRSESFFQS